ncbi:RsfA family transcriptional regulator [Bacillus thuringiensis]|nr:RsfA family transcriptional regulator [Bacillus thuringiensis]MED2811703.1 RsfA family transcriptional regulator [Bacillus thuringiensis]MED2829802.1 RsfA family transcriptional regulator [Bacillus thuringiensis]MED2833925.1 RsfA family transcriptional regulator [Bacillus thuringiensis]MED2852461.1 RsfA family transcriptional regulator [Bacillus thuringiensis]
MVISRQDSWTNDNDLLLASTVLQNICNGGTQLAAFKEVAKLLNRTPAACGFRWNSYVRKQYQEEIQQAKQNRKVGNNISPSQQKKETNSLSMTLDDIILFLQNYKKTNEFTNLQSQIKNLEAVNQSLLQRVTMYEEEYRMLLNHIDRSRSLVVID